MIVAKVLENSYDRDMMVSMASLVIDKASVEPNFASLYAGFCNELNRLPKVEVRQCLLLQKNKAIFMRATRAIVIKRVLQPWCLPAPLTMLIAGYADTFVASFSSLLIDDVALRLSCRKSGLAFFVTALVLAEVAPISLGEQSLIILEKEVFRESLSEDERHVFLESLCKQFARLVGFAARKGLSLAVFERFFNRLNMLHTHRTLLNLSEDSTVTIMSSLPSRFRFLLLDVVELWGHLRKRSM